MMYYLIVGYILYCLLIFSFMVRIETRRVDICLGEAIQMFFVAFIPLINLLATYYVIIEFWNKSEIINNFVVFKKRTRYEE